MKKPIHINIYRECIKYFTDEYQLIKMMEEIGELNKAAAKYLNNPNKETLDSVIEEMADVDITMNHIRYRFDTYKREKIYKDGKINRLYHKLLNK